MTILVVILFLFVFWYWVRERLREMESRWTLLNDRITSYGFRLDAFEARLSRLSIVPAPPVAPPKPEPKPEPRREPVVTQPPVVERPLPASTPPAARPPAPPPPTEPIASVRRDWEETLGGNWLNKAGVLLLVVGLALALGYSFAHIGPAGRVAVSLVVSFAMLVAGSVFESRPRYQVFARGLLGGGWAALYTTVYAMHAVSEARIIESAELGAVLLIAVAAAMILHTLKYRSQTVTGLAYFVAFLTLVITQVNSLAVAALIPLAASVLYLAHRFAWPRIALFGLIATYSTCILRGDSGAPLWQSQAAFAAFWLLFEIYDILHPENWLLPLNAAGFLGLSLTKWHTNAPQSLWMLLAGTAAAYLASSLIRARSGKWHGAATLAAGLAAAAIFQKLDYQWVATALVAEAQLVYLLGLRLRKPYLRWLAASLFTLELGRLLLFDIGSLPKTAWLPVASVDVVVFYANRAMSAADVFYGYAGAFLIAVIAGEESNEQTCGLAWLLSGVAPFLWGWWRRLVDFRIQGYALAILGAAGIAIAVPQPVPALAVAAVLGYAATFAATRLSDNEADALRTGASAAAVLAVTALLWRVVPGEYLGLSWIAAALLLLELGLPQAQVLAAVGAVRVLYFNALSAQNEGPWIGRAIPAGASALSYSFGWRARRTFPVASFAGSVFCAIALWTLLPPLLVGPAWALLAVALMELGIPILGLQAHMAAAAAFTRMFYTNFDNQFRLLTVGAVVAAHYWLWWRSRWRPYTYAAAVLAAVLFYHQIGWQMTAAGWALFAIGLFSIGLRFGLPDLRWQSYTLAAVAASYCFWTNIAGGTDRVAAASVVVASLFAGQFLAPRSHRARTFFALLAAVTTTLLLFYEVSGSMLTVAWSIEGTALLAAGFGLRDRLLRLPGLTLLLGCILKLFLWDLRHLDTLPRIFSFIVLGLILVAVSWVYSRFREQVSRLL